MSNLFSRLNPKLVTFVHLNTKFHRSYVLALFTNLSAVAAVLPLMAKLSVILRSECVNLRISALTGKRVKGDDYSAIKEHFLFLQSHT